MKGKTWRGVACLMVFVVRKLTTMSCVAALLLVLKLANRGRSCQHSYKIRNPDVLKLYSGVGHHIGSGSTVILVEYFATQTGGATANNSFKVRFKYTKIN